MLARSFYHGIVAVSALALASLPFQLGRALRAEERPATPDLLRDLLKDDHAEGSDLWIYNDIPRGIAEARRLGRPLFVTFRCVPCKACAGFDAEVASGSEEIEELARDKFVCVRQVEMKGVDLSLFQFDYDLNWAAMFLHPDGAIYARYGTQSARGPDAYNSIAGLKRTMLRVLELHAAYPRNRAELAGKRGPEKPYRTALDMPGLENKEKHRGPTTRGNCIHCHTVHDAEHIYAQRTGSFTRDRLWKYPLPEALGVTVDADDGRKVREVLSGSPAARAGLQAGEELTHVDGQAIASIADIQWALHRLAPGKTALEVKGSRSGARTLDLAPGWKESDISWRGSIWSVSPRLRVWAPELNEGERKKRGLSTEHSALLVRWINAGEPGGRAARDAGLREGDVIVRLAGKPFAMTPAQFSVHVKLHYKVGDELPLTVLRDGKEREVRIRLVE